MKRYRLTPRALQDLDAIADYSLKEWGERQTLKYISEIEDRLVWLGEHPLLGRAREDIGPNYRSFRQGSHIIFYLIGEELITIIGIPHAAMDIQAHFESPD